jgi:amino acid transporter
VFSNGSQIITSVGSPGMSLVIWLFGALVAYCGGFSYAEWALMIPESGGDTPYLEYVYKYPKQLASFMYCWCRIFLAHPAITSALCILSSDYIFTAFPVHKELDESVGFIFIKKALSLVFVAGIWALLAFSNTVATRANSYITLGKIVLCLFVVLSGILFAAGAFPGRKTRPLSEAFTFAGSSTDPAKYAEALSQVFFCYEGWAYLGSSMGELQNTKRNAPRAIIGGVTIVAMIYLFVNMSYLLVLTPQEVIKAGSTLGSVFTRELYGPAFGSVVMSLLITISAFGSGLATSFASSRIIFEAAKRGFVPFASLFSKTHQKYATPLNAISLHCLISAVIVIAAPPGKGFGFLVELCMYGIWVFYTITTVALLILRMREPKKDRPFRTSLICPVVIIWTGIFVSVFPFMSKSGRLTGGIGIAVLSLGLPMWYFLVARRNAL